MSEPSAFGFGQFVPGFDFLQNLSKSASPAQPAAAAGMPGMGSWVAPTLSIEDIDKRIQELKSVLFWLEQNTTALKATIQAMEVQKMTLTTLQSMNVNMADLAKAFTAKPPVAEPSPASAVDASAAEGKSSFFTPKPAAQPVAQPAAEPSPSARAEPTTPADASADNAADTAAENASGAAKPAVDPMQWWGALTQQFQGIAAAAMKDVAGEAMKAGMAVKTAAKTAKSVKTPAGRKAQENKATADKTAAGKTVASKSAKSTATSRAKVASKAPIKAPIKAPAKAAAKSAQAVRSPVVAAAPRKTAKK